MLELIKKLFWVSRPISWINTAYPFAAGFIVTGGRSAFVLVIGTLFFLVPYNLTMYGVNDVYDYESDIRNPRKGGIEGALAGRKYHRAILIAAVLTMLPFLGYLLTTGSRLSKIWLLFAVFMVLAYSLPKLRFKERPLLDSFTSATHFVSPLIYALLLTGWHISYVPAVVAFFAWGMASHAFGAVQDIVPDREASIASIATVLGARHTIYLICGLYALAALALLAYGAWGVVVAIAVIPYLLNAGRYRLITDATSLTVNAGWRRFLLLNLFAGFIVTQVLIWSRIL
jgi:4-hydroxybenzoate polyprenyltransferase